MAYSERLMYVQRAMFFLIHGMFVLFQVKERRGLLEEVTSESYCCNSTILSFRNFAVPVKKFIELALG